MLTVSHFDSALLSYLSSSVCTYQPSHSCLSSTEQLLKIPKTDLKTFGGSFFSYSTPTVWNSLPADLKASPSFQTFKAKINTHLFHQTFWLICIWSLLPVKCLCMSVCVCVHAHECLWTIIPVYTLWVSGRGVSVIECAFWWELDAVCVCVCVGGWREGALRGGIMGR